MNHDGLCANLHGHRYFAEVTVEASDDELDDVGRVVDFSVVKEKVGGWLDEHWDHATILNEADTELVEFLADNGFRLWTMTGDPSAENMALFLLDLARRKLDGNGLLVTLVKVFETPQSWAVAEVDRG